jgi:hypothetical protein
VGLTSREYVPPTAFEQKLRVAGFVVSVCLLVASLIYKYAVEGYYNPMLMTQFIYLSLFFKVELTSQYFYFCEGYKFANLLFYPINLIGKYRETAPFFFARYDTNANILINAIIPLAVGTLAFLLLLFAICCSKQKKVLATFIWMLTVALVPIFFNGIAQSFSFFDNQDRTNVLYFSLGIFAAALALQLLVMVVWFIWVPTESEPDCYHSYGHRLMFMWDGLRRVSLIGILSISFTTINTLGAKFLVLIEGFNVIITFLTFRTGDVPMALIDAAIAVFLTLV